MDNLDKETTPHDIVIGYDAKRIVSNTTGLGSYGRTLINSLASMENSRYAYRLYAPDEGFDDLRLQILPAENVSFAYPQRTRFRFQKDLWRTHTIIKDLVKDDISIFHGLSGELPTGLRKTGIHGVVTIHDLIFLRHPEYYNWIDTKIYAAKFRKTCKEAERIIAISECTKRDIIHYGNVDESKIDVIYQSCGVRYGSIVSEEQRKTVADMYKLPHRYILNVGSIERRKNVLLAVKAMKNIPEDVSLVIVGRHTKYTDEVKKYIDKNGLSSRVHFFYGVPDDDLPAFYQLAECFVYPSRYEGFGIPIIEAIQSGLPVVACEGSVLEEAGGPDCLYVNPDDVEAMAAAIKQSLKGAEQREQRIERSREYVHRFENSNVAQQVMDIYDRILKGDK